jgi:tripeptide aminopeptidase
MSLLVATGCAPAVAQEVAPSALAKAILRDAAVVAARQAVVREEPRTLDTQVALCEIAAPPFGEGARAEAVRKLFLEAGLASVRVDQAGNVLGERAGERPRPRVVVSAHLDTVFPQGTNVRVTRSGYTFKGPGIVDDCRGLAVLVTTARALTAHGLKTGGPVTFVATVGEEGVGDLRGVRHLFGTELRGQVDRFISLDGAGLDIVTRAVGSKRYRITINGPGGHSYGNFGMANPIHALGRLMARVADLQVPAEPRTTFNIGRIGGGTSVNAIPSEAWLEIDLRSSSPQALNVVDRQLKAAVDDAVGAENRRWNGRRSVNAVVRPIGDRPAGHTPDDDPLVALTRAMTAAVGGGGQIAEGSTDANIPMDLGIPAVTLGAGGNGSGEHSPEETFDATDSAKGTERALLAVLAASAAQP